MIKKSTLCILQLALSLQVSGQFNTSAAFLEKHVHYLASDNLLGRVF